jgi:O-acetyl-ADP-ribose deacetylase (regulator of RNase III)
VRFCTWIEVVARTKKDTAEIIGSLVSSSGGVATKLWRDEVVAARVFRLHLSLHTMIYIVFKGPYKGTRASSIAKSNAWIEKNGRKQKVKLEHVQKMKMKTMQKKTSTFDKPSDSEYTTSSTRVDRAANRDAIRDLVDKKKTITTLLCGDIPLKLIIPTPNGFIGLMYGSVLGLANKNDLFWTAMLNAANEDQVPGGGIDGAICDAGGDVMNTARASLPVRSDNNKRGITGGVVVTVPGNIAVDCVIHAVGPRFGCMPLDLGYVKLFEAYWNALNAKWNSSDCTFIGMCFLSSGIFRGNAPLSDVVSIGFLAAYAYTKKNHTLKFPVFAAFNYEEQRESFAAMSNMKSAIQTGKMNEYLSGFPQSLKDIYNRACKTGSIF